MRDLSNRMLVIFLDKIQRKFDPRTIVMVVDIKITVCEE